MRAIAWAISSLFSTTRLRMYCRPARTRCSSPPASVSAWGMRPAVSSNQAIA